MVVGITNIDSAALIQSYREQLRSFRSSKTMQDNLLNSQSKKMLQEANKEVEEQKMVEELENLEHENTASPNIYGDSLEPGNYLKDSIESKHTEEPMSYREQFSVFNLNYDFESDTYVDFEEINPIFLQVPSEQDIYKFCKKIMICSKMEHEIPIIALLYIEKLMLRTGLLMNQINWRRFTFIALVIASKIWDDESFENIHFTKVFPDISLKEINELERVYLELLEYHLHVGGSEYAKYYFILRAFAEKVKGKFPLKPIPLSKVLSIQQNAMKVGEELKEEYQLHLLEKTM